MKRRKAVLIITIVLLSCLIIGTSFALWIFSQKQVDNNYLTSGCLNITFTNETGTLSIDKAFPVKDSVGRANEGYTFTVKNTCNEKASYLVNFDVFTLAGVNNLNPEDVKIAIDNRVGRTLDKYENADKSDKNASYAKNIYSGVLQPYEEYTHTVKLWVDINVGNEAQNAKFQGQIFVIAGQNIKALEVTPDDCFVTNGNTLVRYKNYYCSGEVVVPRYINGVEITNIGLNAFSDGNVIMYYNWDADERIFIVLDEENYDTIVDMIIKHTSEGEIWESTITYVKASEFTHWDYIASSGGFTVTNDAVLMYVPVYLTNDDYDVNAYNDLSKLSTDSFGLLYDKSKYRFSLTYLDLSRLTNLSSIHYLAKWSLDLTNIELPDSLTSIQDDNFYHTNLQQIFLPSSLNSLGNSSFSYSKINQLEFNSPVTVYDNFSGITFNSLVVNDTLTLKGNAFKDASGLTSDNVKIGYYSNNTLADFYVSE